MIRFSIIIPVYNRPEEINELLQSLTTQTNTNFSVIIVEDGSTLPCESIVEQFKTKLTLSYFYKKNEGRSIARNFGIAKADADYFIIVDSDCILPEHYFQTINLFLEKNPVDCFGGPDREHHSFSPVQKAISYSMTSFLTTGGLRGGKKKITKFYPRSFNMGFNKKVMEVTGGFPDIPLAEDIDLSFRIEKAGLKIALIKDAYVYHKRRTNFTHFFKQVNRFGIGRIDLYKKYPETLKLTHFIPALFILFILSSIIGLYWTPYAMHPLGIYLFTIGVDATLKYKNITIGILSVYSTLVQFIGYGMGFIKAFVKRVLFNQSEFAGY